MNFSTMQQEVAAQSALDSSDSSTLTLIKRWINITQQDIASRWPWEFLYSEEIITTTPDYTQGTASVASGGTTVSGSGTGWTSDLVGRYIQFEGSLEWYLVSAWTSAVYIEISPAYNGTTNLSAVTYTIRKIYYSLSSSADAIITVRNMNTPIALYEGDIFMMDELYPNTNSTGTTFMFITYGYDSSGNIRISPYPWPSDKRSLQIRTLKRVTDLSGDSDTSIIPAKWHHIIIYGSLGLAFSYKNNFEASNRWVTMYEKKIDDMIMKQRVSEDNLPIINSIDAGRRSTYISFPANYPRI